MPIMSTLSLGTGQTFLVPKQASGQGGIAVTSLPLPLSGSARPEARDARVKNVGFESALG